jgi:hypothetical protein
MEKIINRLEAIHRALRNAPIQGRRDALVAESVALCLRELHAIAAQARGDAQAGPSLRLIHGERGARVPASQRVAGLFSHAHDHAETPS